MQLVDKKIERGLEPPGRGVELRGGLSVVVVN